jgi:hypothetical protein
MPTRTQGAQCAAAVAAFEAALREWREQGCRRKSVGCSTEGDDE